MPLPLSLPLPRPTPAKAPPAPQPLSRPLLAEEQAVAITINGSTQAVMMATPADLEDFALGFLVTEGLATPDQVEGLEILAVEGGTEARIWLAGPAAERVAARRRRMAGPVGCGLCGIDSLAEALRPLPQVPEGRRFDAAAIPAAMAALAAAQPLRAATGALHAAGLWRPDAGLIVREDVGRHNALDKLAGALARAGIRAAEGLVLLSSRVSVEMVQKAAMIGAPVLVAASAPTTLAAAQARAAGLTLVTRVRGPAFDIHSRPDRIGQELPDAG